jgi:hypothetical protein
MDAKSRRIFKPVNIFVHLNELLKTRPLVTSERPLGILARPAQNLPLRGRPRTGSLLAVFTGFPPAVMTAPPSGA